MNVLRIIGLIFIGAAMISILAAVIVGNEVKYFIASIALGIIGNIFWWLGGRKLIGDEPEESESIEEPRSGGPGRQV